MLPLLHPEPAEVKPEARVDECEEIPLSRPDISDADIQAVVDVLADRFPGPAPE